MTEQDPRDPVRPDVWGDGTGRPLDPALDPDRYVPDVAVPGRPLDPALDPDRYVADPGGLEAVGLAAAPGVPLDPAGDPDRFRGGAPSDRTLTELLGEGAQEEPRDSYVWLIGLLSVLVFLFLVSQVARNLGP